MQAHLGGIYERFPQVGHQVERNDAVPAYGGHAPELRPHGLADAVGRYILVVRRIGQNGGDGELQTSDGETQHKALSLVMARCAPSWRT